MWGPPAVIALYAPLALLASNVLEVRPSVAERSIVASLVMGLAATALSYVLYRNREKAIVLASASIVVFFTYGHIYDGLKRLGPVGVLVARHRYLVPVDGLLILGLVLLLARRPSIAPALSRWLAASAWIFLAFPSLVLIPHLAKAWSISGQATKVVPTAPQPDEDEPRDIFYIVLDGYGRSDILKASYGYDNTPFLGFLRSRGFYVADRAMSNYSRTLLSLSSSLNMDYLDKLLGQTGFDSTDHQPLYDQMQHNRVFDLFRSLGYSIVAFETGYHPTELMDADVYLTPAHSDVGRNRVAYREAGLNEFEGLFLQGTMATVAFDFYVQGIQRRTPGLIDYEYEKHRTRVLFTISSLSDIAAQPGAHFVFAHIVSPHPPFVFGPNGERLVHRSVFSMTDQCCQGDDYVERYVGQVQYLNILLKDEIDEILRISGGNVIIVFQGDHGPAGLLDWAEPNDPGLHDRMAILNAYYLPAAGADALYSSITPVNTFRVIFNRYYGGEFDRLEDASYFSATLGLSAMTRVLPSP